MLRLEIIDVKKIIEGYKDPSKIKVYAEAADDKVEIVVDFGSIEVVALRIVLRRNKLEVDDYWGYGDP